MKQDLIWSSNFNFYTNQSQDKIKLRLSLCRQCFPALRATDRLRWFWLFEFVIGQGN